MRRAGCGRHAAAFPSDHMRPVLPSARRATSFALCLFEYARFARRRARVLFFCSFVCALFCRSPVGRPRLHFAYLNTRGSPVAAPALRFFARLSAPCFAVRPSGDFVCVFPIRMREVRPSPRSRSVFLRFLFRLMARGQRKSKTLRNSRPEGFYYMIRGKIVGCFVAQRSSPLAFYMLIISKCPRKVNYFVAKNKKFFF